MTVPLTPSTEAYLCNWARRVKYALNNPVHQIRLSEQGLAIEVRSDSTRVWQPIMLPGIGGTGFASDADRLIMFEMVTGRREIPENKPQEIPT